MGLDKSVQYRKEKRKPYYGVKAIDAWCRNHGECEWCRRNRLHQVLKEQERMKDLENERNEV